MSENRRTFTHLKADRVITPRTAQVAQMEKGETPHESEPTRVVIDPEGKIAFIGTPSDADAFLRARRDEGAEVTEEIGGLVLPGMTDSHYHPGIYGSVEIMHTCDVSRARNIGEIQQEVRRALQEKKEQMKPGEPLLVLDYDSSRVGKFGEYNFDELGADRPLFLLDRSFHGGAGNTQGIELLRSYVEREFPQRVMKNGKYDVPGFLKGQEFTEGYVFLVLDVVESFRNVGEVSEAVEKKVEDYLVKGVTAIHEMEVISWNEFMAYLLFHERWKEKQPGLEFPVKRLFLDARVMEKLAQEQEGLMQSGLLDSEIKKILGLKLLADGSFGCQTALLSDPYKGAIGKHKHGVIFTRMKEAERAMRAALRVGVDKVATHAIGDDGIRRAIEMAQKWQKLGEQRGLQPEFRFEHFELPTGDSVKRAGQLGAWASMQSNFGVEDFVYGDRLGERTKMLCPHADMVNEGVPMMLGSDGMPPSMLYVMWSAMHHPDPAQRLDVISALTAATAAVGSYEGSTRGTLQQGAPADIIIASPGLMNALADGNLAEEYYSEALKSPDQRQDIPIRDKVGELEGHVQKVFRQGRVVYDAKQKNSQQKG